MPSGKASAQTWIQNGTYVFNQGNLAEATRHFEAAVEIDPESVQARLCLGVACLFLYQNTISEPDENFLDPDYSPSPEDSAAEMDRTRSRIVEQNATNGKRAEENLQYALQLDPQNKLVMEYLAALYYAWMEPTANSMWTGRRSRLVDAQHCYGRLLEVDAKHKFANYVCGVIDWQRAYDVMRLHGSYPLPLLSENARRPLRAQVGGLLEDSRRNLLRSLEIDPNRSSAMSYLSQVERAKAYIAGTTGEDQRANAAADEWDRKVNQILKAEAKASGKSWPPRGEGVVTFRRIPPELLTPERLNPPFPPDPQYMIPIGLPPPPVFEW